MNDANLTADSPVGSDPHAAGPVRQLNSLLRGEISACETYRQAIESIADSDDASARSVDALREIESEHTQAVGVLRQRIQELGGVPADSSGAWGALAQTVQGTANLFGDAATLKSLKEGEEHGLKDFNQSLPDLDIASRDLIVRQFIPAQQRHLSLIDQLMTVTGQA